MTKTIEELESLIREQPEEYIKQEGTITNYEKDPEIPNSVMYGFAITVMYYKDNKEKIHGFDITDTEFNDMIKAKKINKIEDLLEKKVMMYVRKFSIFDEEDVYDTVKADIYF